jgi:subtilase family serine protease
VPKRVCGAATPGHAACNAIVAVPATASTDGARAYQVGAAFTAGPAGGYTPGDLATAYGFDADSSVGANQTVGIVDAYANPNALANLNNFDAQYGLPAETAASLQIVNQNGATSPLPAGNTGWGLEITLDLDAVRGLCHQCKIILVETDTNSFANLAAGVQTAINLGAGIVSNSYGGRETASTTPSDAAAFAQLFTHPGAAVLVSTGDDGWRDFDHINPFSWSYPSDGPQLPSSLPGSIAVGGTTLSLSASDQRTSETVWNRNGVDDTSGWNSASAAGAGGGGCSVLYNAARWQTNVAGWSATGCGTKRLAADVAAIADPYLGYDIYDTYGYGGWLKIGGTSLATPVVAAMWALAGGPGGSLYPATTLYDQFASSSSKFFDVTAGGNSYCGGDTPSTCATSGPLHGVTGGANNPNGTAYHTVECSFDPYPSTSGTVRTNNKECNATAGYDGPTGVGVPNGVAALTAIHPTMKINKPSTVALHKAATYKALFTTTMGGESSATYSWKFGDGSATSSGKSPKHTYTHAGTYTVSVFAIDGFGRTTGAVASITVGMKPKVKIHGPSSLKARAKGKFKASGSDPNTGGSIATFKWKFGDGSKGNGPKVKHAFAHKGTYTVKVTATDNTGVKASKKLKVKVT